MNIKIDESNENIIDVSLEGKFSPEDTIKYYEEIILMLRAKSRKGVIVDITAVTGTPGVFEIYRMISGLGVLMELNVKIAVIGGVENEAADGFAATVAHNRGIKYMRFQDRSEARKWIITSK